MKIVVGVVLVCWTILGMADVYKWTDANGQVHYSDKPAAQAVNKKKINVKSTISKRESAEARRRLEVQIRKQNQDAATRNVKEAQVQRSATPRKNALVSSCGESKVKLRPLKDKTVRVYTRGRDGERRWLGAEERDSEIAKHQEYINQNCN